MRNRKSRAPAIVSLLVYYSYILGTSRYALCLKPHLNSLASLSLGSLTYDKIHESAVNDQIHYSTRPQKSLQTRNTKLLNGLYDFCLDTQETGFGEAWYLESLRSKCNKTNFYRMPVPSAVNDIASDRKVRDYIGWFWYQTVINLYAISQLKDYQRYIQFDNVNYLALVWTQQLDGCQDECETQLVGHHVGGFLPFIVNISSFRGSKMRVTIAVSNKLTKDTIPSGRLEDLSEVVGRKYLKFQPDFDFFHYAGIMGDVSFFQVPAIHIYSVDQVHIADTNFIWLKVCLNDYSSNLKLTVQVSASDEKELFSGLLNVSKKCQLFNIKISHDWPDFLLAAGSVNHFSTLLNIRLRLENLSFETAELGLLDVYEQKVVYRRSVTFDLKKGLIVNGTRRQLQGFGMHQEQLFSGRAISQAAILKDVYLLKQLGANVIRTSHYPYSSEYLDACDENGILVIVESAAVGLNSFSDLKLALHKQLLREMVHLHHHHPSVIAWSVANEPASQIPTADPYFQSLLSYARKELAQFTIHSGRPLTAAIAQQASSDLLGKSLDLVMVNAYYGWYDYTGIQEAVNFSILSRLTSWSKKHPGKPLLISEFGAASLPGFHSSYGAIFSEEYQRDLLLEHEQVFDEVFCLNRSINFLGSMLWNFADFNVHDSLMRPGGNRKGVFARDRSPKLAVESLRSHYLFRLNQEKGEYENECTSFK